MKRYPYSYLSTIILFLLIIPYSHADNPIPYLTEQATQELYTNGTIKTPMTASGRLEISVPNTPDVLQYIRINISNAYIGKTNIISPETFADVAASPLPQDRSPMNLDTTGGYNIRYNITNHSIIPHLSSRLTHKNALGGKDIISGSPNIILFNLTITSDTTITGAEMTLRIKENTYTPDSIVLGTPQATSSTTLNIQDTDSDTYADTLYWQGDLTQDTPIYITFPGTTQANINYNRGDQYVDLNEPDATQSTHTEASAFTSTTITSRFSRGPIRQGLQMGFSKNVSISGTITNMAQGLTYSLASWRLYNVTNLTHSISSGTLSLDLNPGETYNTPWYLTPDGGLKYFVSEFDWRVKWAPSIYQGTTSTILDLPILYQADGIAQKSISTILTNPFRIVDIEDKATHFGHTSIYFNSTTVLSAVPSGYTISNVTVYYSNTTIGGSEYNITSDVTTQVTSNTLNITIDDISKILGRQLALNEDIIIRYRSSGPVTSSPYTFISNNTFIMNTTSRTPLTLTSTSSQLLPPVLPPAQPDTSGGGGAPPAAIDFASIEKDSAEIIKKDQSNTVKINTKYRIIDTSDKGIGSIYSSIILPSGSTLNQESIKLSIYNPYLKRWITYNSNNLIIKKDPDIKDTTQYTINIISKRWDQESINLNLKDNALYSLAYEAELPEGTSQITTRLTGFNYYTDRTISKDIETSIRITTDSSSISLMDIKDSPFQPQPIIVGKPPRWLKTIDIYNPNSVSVSHEFMTRLFPEVISSRISTDATPHKHDLDSRDVIYALFKDTIDPGEKKTYLFDITTPPVLITDEVYSIDKYENTKLLFTTNITLTNPSGIDYSNITLIYPIGKESIISAEENGTSLTFNPDGSANIRIIIPSIKKKTSTTISLHYLKIPPILIANVDKPSYTPGEKVNLTILFIPNENISRSVIQIEVSEINKDRETIYAEIEKLTALEKNIPHTTSYEFTTPDANGGKYIVHATASLAPQGEITDTTDFKIENDMAIITKFSILILLIAALLIIIHLIHRIYTRKEFKDELKSLKKEIENI